jgi:hypothetical protein
MTRLALTGLLGTSPLGFMSAVGLLRILHRRDKRARLGFVADGLYHAFVETDQADLPSLVSEDAELAAGERGWRLEYVKSEKPGGKPVADLKAPPDVFKQFLERSVAAWVAGDSEPVAYAAAFGTSTAVDGKGNTKPTALHFTAANQQFLGGVELIRSMVSREWAKESLFVGGAMRPGGNLRWDPGAERNWALMASNPTTEGTSVDAPAEWLAFRALPLFPCVPRGRRVITTGVDGRGDDMIFRWPLWSPPSTLASIVSVLTTSWVGSSRERLGRGVFAVCSSAVRRTNQGFGNFGPAEVTP